MTKMREGRAANDLTFAENRYDKLTAESGVFELRNMFKIGNASNKSFQGQNGLRR